MNPVELSRFRRFAASIGVACISVFIIGMGTTPAPNNTSLQKYRNDLLEYFKPQFLLPILISTDQKVGDVYEMGFWTYLDRSEKCFPGLKVTAPSPISMPSLFRSKNVNIHAEGSVIAFGNLLASTTFSDEATIRFSDAVVRKASRGDLKDALDRNKCGYLSVVVDGGVTNVKEGGELPVVIGMVLSAKRVIFIAQKESITDEAKAQVKYLISEKYRNVKPDFLNASASAQLGYGNNGGLLIESEHVEPVAFAPAFLPALILDHTRGGGDKYEFAVQWKPFEASNDIDQAGTFNHMIDRAIQPR